jgi:hypothetical protein
LLETLEQLNGRERLDPGGSELEGQRQVVERTTDLGHGLVLVEVGSGRSRPRVEEGDAVVRREGRDGVLVLRREMEGLAARHEQVEHRALGEQIREAGRSGDHVLEVVEEDEHSPPTDMHRQRFLGAQGLSRSGDDELWVTKRRQRHPPDPARIAVRSRGRRLESQPGLSRSAGSREREQPNLVGGDEVDHLAELAIPAQEPGRGHRQVRLEERRQRREHSRAELVDPLRRREVLEPVLAQVTQALAGGKHSRGGGGEHLAAVPGRCNSRRAVDVLADVTLVGDDRSPRVEAHADADRPVREPGLCLRGGPERARRRWKRVEERVALCVDLDAPGAREGGSD